MFVHSECTNITNNFEMKFLEITTCSKLQVPKTQLIFVLKGIPNKKNSTLKINIACFSTNLFSLYYQPWHIWNPDTFIMRGIFRALEYSKVRRYVHDVSTFNVFFHLFLMYSKRFQEGICPDTIQRMDNNTVPSNAQYTSTLEFHASTQNCRVILITCFNFENSILIIKRI